MGGPVAGKRRRTLIALLLALGILVPWVPVILALREEPAPSAPAPSPSSARSLPDTATLPRR